MDESWFQALSPFVNSQSGVLQLGRISAILTCVRRDASAVGRNTGLEMHSYAHDPTSRPSLVPGSEPL